MIKRFIEYLISKTPYTLTKEGSIGFNAPYLSKICKPKTVFDVGVGYGTPELYKAYPDAHFILVEPLQQYRASIDAISNQYRCDVYYKAVGEYEGELQFNIDPQNLQKSSFQNRTNLTKSSNAMATETIEVTTLDHILIQNSNISHPALLKIDTEGHELSALKGATKLLKVVDTVIVEVSIAKRFSDGYEFEDLILFMKNNGFHLYSFLSMPSSSRELRQRYTDIVFKRELNES